MTNKKRDKASSYIGRFSSLKREFLNLKWDLDMNLTPKKTIGLRKRIDKLGELLFAIEREFEKHKED